MAHKYAHLIDLKKNVRADLPSGHRVYWNYHEEMPPLHLMLWDWLGRNTGWWNPPNNRRGNLLFYGYIEDPSGKLVEHTDLVGTHDLPGWVQSVIG